MDKVSIKKSTQRIGVLFLSMGVLAIYLLLLSMVPIADLTKEFGFPSSVVAMVNWYLDTGAVVSVITTLLLGLGSGGLGLIAAAGKASVKVYLKKQRDKLGKRAFAAW